MTPLELITALRRASEKATSGEWNIDGDWYGKVEVVDSVILNKSEDILELKKEDAAYITLANPTNIKVLLDTLERAVEALEALVNSEAIKEAPMLSYSEAYSNARDALEKLK